MARAALPAVRPASSRSSARPTRRPGGRWSGRGDRSDKVRTYNFPQDRVTDHRIGMTVHNLPGVMDGDLDDLIDALQMADQADRLGDADRGRRGLTWSRWPTVTGELLHEGAERLRAAGSETPRLDAELLLGSRGRASGGPRSWPITTPPSAPTRRHAYRASIERRAPANRSPTSAGSRSSTASRFAVDARALIPRPETEALVDARGGRGHAAARRPRTGRAARRRSGSPTSARGAARSPSRWSPRCGAAGPTRRSTSSRPTSRPTPWTSPARTRSATRSPTRSGSSRPTSCRRSSPTRSTSCWRTCRTSAATRWPGLPVATSFEPALALDGGADGLARHRAAARPPAGRARAGRRRAPRDRRRPGRGDRGARGARACRAGRARVEPDLAGLPGSPSSSPPEPDVRASSAMRRSSSGRARPDLAPAHPSRSA